MFTKVKISSSIWRVNAKAALESDKQKQISQIDAKKQTEIKKLNVNTLIILLQKKKKLNLLFSVFFFKNNKSESKREECIRNRAFEEFEADGRWFDQIFA